MNQNYFEQLLLSLEKQYTQQHRVVRQNKYFSVIDEGVKGELNDNGKPNEWFKVQLKGLLNPKLNIVQSYELLNPFDQIIKVENIIQKTQYEPQSKRVRQFLWELQFLSTNTEEKLTDNKDQKSKINKKHKYSMFFLYYLKKIYNTVWRRCGNDSAKFKEQIENLQIKVFYGFYKMKMKMKVSLYQICFLFELLQFQKLPETIKMENYHLGMQQFLLYKLYKTYGISCEWSERYQSKLLEIDEDSFEQLYEFEQKLKQHTIDNFEIEKSIIEHKFYYNQEQQNTEARQVVSYLLENLRNYQLPLFYTYSNKQEFQIFGLKVRTIQKQQNRQQEANNNENANGNQVPDNNNINNNENNNNNVNNNDNDNKQKKQQLNPAQTLYLQYINDDLKLRWTQYLAQKCHFPFTQTLQSQPIYLYQLQNAYQIYKSSKQMFDSLVSIVAIDYFQWFKLFRRKGFQLRSDGDFQMRKYLICLNNSTLIWRDSIGRMEYDRLQMWKLIFAMEYSPDIINADDIDVGVITKLEPSLRNLVHNTIMNIIKTELEPIIMLNTTYLYNQQQPPSYIQIFPFVSLLILAYELNQQPISSVSDFVRDIKEKYKQEKLKQNIKLLAKDLHYQFITKNISKTLEQQTQLQNKDEMIQQQQQQSFITTNNNNNNRLQTYSNQLIFALIQATNQIDYPRNQQNQ